MKFFERFEVVLLLVILFLNIFLFIVLGGFSLTGFFSFEESAPYNFIEEEDILVLNNSILINFSDYVLSKYDSSHSMVPLLDAGANGIGIKPESPENLHVGDIISFKKGDNLIVHRIIKKGVDDSGIFFITKGDNNFFNDGKIRFEEIDSVLVILVY